MIKMELLGHIKSFFMQSPREEMGKAMLFPQPRAQESAMEN